MFERGDPLIARRLGLSAAHSSAISLANSFAIDGLL